MSERPTFSPFWHRVRAMKPRLRPHVQITRQHYRGRRWHVVHDPATNQFYRLNPIAHEFVSLLDGSRTVDEVWTISLGRHGDQAPTQNEIIQLISQLYNANLLSVDTSPETEQLLRRGKERFRKKATQQAIGIMYFRIRAFNPDRLLAWVEPILRPVLNRWGFLAWLAFLVIGLVNILPHFDQLTNRFDTAIAPANWGWLIVVFVVTKAWHELGHGVICKRLGGQVPEFGFMLLVLFPAPYVDASAAWSFANKWQRMAVGAGGMIFELFLATIAAFVWLATNVVDGQDPLIAQLAYNAMLTASVSTVLFNANPLMRFDGYYILSDLLEVPNLMQRSMNQLKYYMQRYVYRVKQAQPASTQPGEVFVLVVYGIAALIYRVFLFFSITLYVMGKLFAIGLILAVWTAAMWFILPVGKFVHWLATSPQLADFRGRAVATSVAMVVGGLVLVGAIPMPDHRRGEGVIESVQRSGVFFGTDGFVIEAHVRPGDRVRAGDPILTCDSPDLRAELAYRSAELREQQVREQDATARSPTAAAIARQRVETLRTQVRSLEERVAKLVVRAPNDGVVVSRDPGLMIGSLGRKGDPVCEVVDDSRIRVAATLTTAQAAPLIELGPEGFSTELRLVSDAGRTLQGAAVRLVEAGQRVLPHAALGYAGGGGAELDQSDESGLRTKNPMFVAYVEPAPDGAGVLWTGAPGERVRVRFELPAKPLLAQWADRLHRLIQGRVNI